MPNILIAAAGGRVARRVAAALCARGEPPRALVRNASKARDVPVDNRGAPLPLEMVVSDFAERDGLRQALAGIEIASWRSAATCSRWSLSNTSSTLPLKWVCHTS